MVPQKLSNPPAGNQIDREPEVVIKATHWISDGHREKITSKTKRSSNHLPLPTTSIKNSVGSMD
jgi:hypothetical protein